MCASGDSIGTGVCADTCVLDAYGNSVGLESQSGAGR